MAPMGWIDDHEKMGDVWPQSLRCAESTSSKDGSMHWCSILLEMAILSCDEIATHPVHVSAVETAEWLKGYCSSCSCHLLTGLSSDRKA